MIHRLSIQWFLLIFLCCGYVPAALAQADVPRFGITYLPRPPEPQPGADIIMVGRHERTRFKILRELMKKQEEAQKAAGDLDKKNGKNPSPAGKNSLGGDGIGGVGGIGIVGSDDETGGNNAIGGVGGIGKVGKPE